MVPRGLPVSKTCPLLLAVRSGHSQEGLCADAINQRTDRGRRPGRCGAQACLPPTGPFCLGAPGGPFVTSFCTNQWPPISQFFPLKEENRHSNNRGLMHS